MGDYIREDEKTHLERVFPREALITMSTREWLHRQVNSLMALEIMIPVEALRALVTLERPIVMRWCRLRLVRIVVVHVLHVGGMPAVEVHKTGRETSHEHWRLTWIRKVGKNGAMLGGWIGTGITWARWVVR
jgi:hypothetical protein